MENKTLKGRFEVGQEIDVKIVAPKIGKFPIAHVIDSKIVCIFEKLEKKKFFEIGSTWKVKVVEVKDHNLMISPIKLIKTNKQNNEDFSDKITQLKEKFNNNKK